MQREPQIWYYQARLDGSIHLKNPHRDECLSFKADDDRLQFAMCDILDDNQRFTWANPKGNFAQLKLPDGSCATVMGTTVCNK